MLILNYEKGHLNFQSMKKKIINYLRLHKYLINMSRETNKKILITFDFVFST